MELVDEILFPMVWIVLGAFFGYLGGLLIHFDVPAPKHGASREDGSEL